MSCTGQPELAGICFRCGHQVYIGLVHHCPTYFVPLPVAPQLGVGELDGQCLIEMNNVAVGFVERKR